MGRNHLAAAAVAVLLFACGSELTPGANATIDGALWQEFSASVSESQGLFKLQLDPNGQNLVAAQSRETWQVEQRAASYVQTIVYQDPKFTPQTPSSSQAELSASAHLDLKNSLARYQIFGWQDLYPCAPMPGCTEAAVQTQLVVNLNGEHKTVVWYDSSADVPEEARRMAQVIRDAV